MPIIKKMEAAQTKEQLFEIQKELMQYGDQQFMYMGFGADDKNATENILNIYQGGLTLGQKEYYLDNDEATAKIRAAYKNHIVTMFQLFGFISSRCSSSSASRRALPSRRWSRCSRLRLPLPR